ncbi:thioredoxin family protein [Clostridium sp.]|uniref:thioredoxin family protein n=1 Tax=Clostridium sp. TaxID=1506 RepID=UPI003463AD86
MLSNYPKVKSIKINIDESPSLCAEFSVFIAPTILLFTQGKETLRESRFIVINELDKNINRYYNLMF